MYLHFVYALSKTIAAVGSSRLSGFQKMPFTNIELLKHKTKLSLNLHVCLGWEESQGMGEPPLLGAVPMGEGKPREHKGGRSEEHTSELQSLMRISYAVF